MPTTITGDETTFNTGATVVLTGPADTEGIDAADVNTPLEILADGAEHYRTYGARTNIAQTFDLLQTFSLGIALTAPNNGTAEITGGTIGLLATTLYSKIFSQTLAAGGANQDWYESANGMTIITNASWVYGGAGGWTQTDAAQLSYRWDFYKNGKIIGWYKAAGSGPWADGAWTGPALTLALNAADATLIGTAAGTQIGGPVNIVTSNLFADVGYIQATAGNIIAAGDPASDQGRLKGRQIIPTTAAAPTIVRGPAMDNGVGDGAVTVTGTDVAGNITVTTGAAVAAGGVVCTVTLNKSYPTNPRVLISAANDTTTDIGAPLNAQSTGANTFTIRATAAFPLTAGGLTYGWTYVVIGG